MASIIAKSLAIQKKVDTYDIVLEYYNARGYGHNKYDNKKE